MEPNYVVYVAGSTTYNWTKVGITGDIDTRYQSLQSSVPFQLSLYHVFEADGLAHARFIEKAVLEHFCLYRTSGEWLADADTPAIMKQILIAAKEYGC